MRARIRLCVVCALGMVFLTLSAFLYGDYVDRQRVSKLMETTHSMQVQVSGDYFSDTSVSFQLKELASSNKVSIIHKETRIGDDGQSEVIYSGYYDWETFPVADLELTSGSLPSSEGEFLSTVSTGEEKQTGMMYSLAHGSRVRVVVAGPEQSSTWTGLYYIVSNEEFDASGILQSLSEVFGQSADDLTTINSREATVLGSSFALVAALAALSALLYLLLISVSCLTGAKKIGVQKLLGWSPLAIFTSLCVPASVAQFATAIVVDCVLMVFAAPIGGTFLLALVALQAAFLVITNALGLLSLPIVKKISVSGALKDSMSLRIPVAFAAVLQAATLLCQALLVGALSPSFGSAFTQWANASTWESLTNVYVFASSAKTDEYMSYVTTGNVAYLDKFASLYEYLNDSYGGIYATSFDLNGQAYMVVNVNYLKQYSLTDENGTPISIDEEQEGALALLPSSMDEQDSASVKDYVQLYLSSSDEAERSLWGSQAGSWGENCRFMTYGGARSFFTYSKEVGDAETGMAADPVLIVLTKANITNMMKSTLSQTGSDAPMKLPIDVGEARNLSEWLSQNGFAEDNIKIESLGAAYAEELSAAMGSAAIMLAFVVLLLVFSCMSGSFLAAVLLLANQKRYAVERLLGWGSIARHHVAVGAALGACLVYMASLLLMGTGGVGLTVGASALIVWLVCFYLFIERGERRSALSILRKA